MSLVYIFPGQGSQFCGMGEKLFKKFPDIVALADQHLDYSIEELCLRDPNNMLSFTEYTQPALYVVSVLHYIDKIKSTGIKPDFLMGHSLGEYAALYAAGAFDFSTGLKLVKERGRLMSKAPDGAMAAVLQLDLHTVQNVLGNLAYDGVDIANINSGKQIVISGLKDQVSSQELRAALQQAGGKCVALDVNAAFHSRCMIGVEKKYAEFIKSFMFNKLEIPVVSNYTARFYPTEGFSEHMVKQVSNPVRWYEAVSWLKEDSQANFEELGPGKVLTKLCENIGKEPMNIGRRESQLKINIQTDSFKLPKSISKKKNIGESVFMFSGQGGQYYGMGKQLFLNSEPFRRYFEACSDIVAAGLGRPLSDVVYGDNPGAFDDILYSHAALFSVGYSLANMFIEQGVRPNAVLGHSLGEYVALVIGGAISFEDALDIIIKQALLLKRLCVEGHMLTVLEHEDFYNRRSDIFQELTLGGVNYSRSFFVSGDIPAIMRAKATLEAENVITALLPVRYAFHSPHIDSIKDEFIAAIQSVKIRRPYIPIYSSMLGREINRADQDNFHEFLWDVVRKRVSFSNLLADFLEAHGDRFLLDLSPSGTLANFLKYEYADRYSCDPAINRFTSNLGSIKSVYNKLQAKYEEKSMKRVASI